jgi:hypothetical protein
MRCLKCNVDLGDEYQLCPLCGSQAADEKAVIEGMRTAEYPDVEYRPYPKRKVLGFFIAYLLTCAACMAADYINSGRLGISVLTAFILPCIWVLFIRPFVVKKEYIGSYILQDVFFLALLMLYISKVGTGNFGSALSHGIPILLIVSEIALLVSSLVEKYNRVNSISYLLTGAAADIILIVIALSSRNVTLVLPLAALGTALVSLAIIKGLASKEFNEEIKARFKP